MRKKRTCTVSASAVQAGNPLNLACPLADVFQSVELPETIEEFLDDGVAQCIAFNRRGTLLAGKLASFGVCILWHTIFLQLMKRFNAAGCADGQVVIWDTETRGVAQRYKPHRYVYFLAKGTI